MRRHLLAFVCAVVTLPLFAGGFSKSQTFRPATPEELAMKSVPDAPGAEAAVLDWVRVDDDQNSVTSEYYRIKIFSEEGKKYGDIELTFMPSYPVFGKITDISARTIRPDGTIVPFNGKIYDKTVVKVGRNALRAKTFSLPDVQPGSIIEYRYQLRWTAALLFNTYWSVQRDIPVVHSHFTMIPYDSQGQFGSFFTYMGLPPGVAPKKIGREKFELELTSMPALREEAYAPPEEQLRARVNFYYTDSTVKPEEFWKVQPGVFARQIEDFIGRSKSANELAKKLGAGQTDRAALLRAIYAHTQSLRNLSFEPEKTDQEVKRQDLGVAKNVEDVLRKGSGYSHEINRAFVAIARAAGFEADAARVASRERFFFSNKFPDADQMSAEAVVVTLDGKQVWLDPGTPLAPFGIVSWEKTNVASIRIAKGAKPTWVEVPAHEPPHALTRRKADLRLDGETLTGTVTVTFSGQEALVRRLRTITEDEAARKKSIDEEVKGWFPDGATLTLKSITGDHNTDEALVATYDVVLPNLVSQAGSRTIVPLSVFESQATNPFAPATRTHLIYFTYPNVEEDEVTLTLPESMTVATLPQPAKMDIGAAAYRAEAARNGNAITFKRASSLTTMYVDPKHYTSLRNYFNAVTAADQQPLVLTAAK
ncbi:MAG TPA: DUF3857 and transglutaminase domain-containing protein [Thermoanaerobaculia bacterium]|nr:DUF3857 and transglutaminase domain-containing protein [Thermoanaerobaculia bacterium]